jgi:hypothetical protein
VTASEVIAKLLLSLPALALLVVVWRSEIDLAWLRPERLRTWLSVREPDAVYQEGRIVGRVEGAQVHQQEKLVTFRAIRQTGPMAMGQPFVFPRLLAPAARHREPRALARRRPGVGARAAGRDLRDSRAGVAAGHGRRDTRCVGRGW